MDRSGQFFLIWYSVSELQKVKDTDYLPPSINDVTEITFPSVMICPSVEAFNKTNITAQPTNSAWLSFPLVVNPGLAWSDNAGPGYYVCPAVVSFTSPSNTVVKCVEFTQNPTYNADLFTNMCDGAATTAQWSAAAVTQPANPASINPWKTITADTVLEIAALRTDANYNYPVVALLYSDDGTSNFKRPKDFTDYRKMFSVSVTERVLIPLMATTNLYVKKYIRDDYPKATDCNIEDYETQQDNWGYAAPDCADQSAICETGGTIFLTYDSLAVTTTCHLTKHPLVFGDVLGIVGGGIAIVLAVTLFLSKIISWCASRGETASSVNDNYKGLI